VYIGGATSLEKEKGAFSLESLESLEWGFQISQSKEAKRITFRTHSDHSNQKPSKSKSDFVSTPST
jgi:hypothetical protein